MDPSDPLFLCEQSFHLLLLWGVPRLLPRPLFQMCINNWFCREHAHVDFDLGQLVHMLSIHLVHYVIQNSPNSQKRRVASSEFDPRS